jgi:cystathionine gamma-synthase/O-acetylhomoserine (thiol)-lyase
VVWAETLCNPTMAVADLPRLAAIAHDADALLVVDSTFASPVVCRPVEHGADVVMHSATKYIGGHSDVTGGVLVARPELNAKLRAVRTDLGGSMSPDDAFLLHRGLVTMGLRVRRQCETATWLARNLEGHASLAQVEHPSLSSHPHHVRAKALFEPELYGAVINLSPVGGRDEGMAFVDRLRLIAIATSLGGAHSLASHSASTTHRQYDDAALAAARIAPSSVRLSIGLEDPQDLLEDLLNALA